MRKFIPPELLSFFVLLFLTAHSAFAQNITVSGTVTDQAGNGLPGVSVTVRGTSSGTQTNAQGAFTISGSSSGTLVFSYVGFGTIEEPVRGRTTINVTMLPENEALSEAVVIGYGMARKRDLTGSVTSVKAKDFNQGVITAPDQLLQGKVPGLEITNNSGQPGAATTIKIRGNNSIRANNNPLYVIDGVPLDGRTARPSLNLGGNGLGFGTTPESNPLLYINPADIAQVDVLKDASSAAIYGSRGANGIIVVTTKKGAAGPARLEFGSNWGVTTGFMKKYKVLSAGEFRAMTKKNNLGFDSSASVDPLDALTQHKVTQNYSLAVSGGTETGKFRASFLLSKNEGFIRKTALDKYLASLNGQYKFINDRLSVDFSLIAGQTVEDIALVSNTAGAGGNLISYALNWNPTAAFYLPNGSYRLLSNSVPNPLAVSDGFNDVANVNVFLGNISGAFKILDNLEYKFLLGINHGAGKRRTNIDGWMEGLQGVSGLGFAAITDASLTSQTYTHTLSYRTDFSDNLRFDAVAGYEYWKSSFSNASLYASQFNTNIKQDFRIPILYTSMFQNARTQFPSTTTVDPEVEIQSMFGRVNFNLQDKYYLTGTLRADGSNKFGRNNRYGYFPSVGVKWALSNEDFFDNITAFNNLGLRASWGITGNQEFPAGASLEQFTSGAYNSIGQSNVANPDLKWEKTTSVNVGLDYAFAGNRVYGSIDWYRKNTTDLLFQSTAIQPAPASIYFINLDAELINSGVEVGIGTVLISKPEMMWDFGVNFSYNKNLLTKFKQAPIPTGQVSGQGVSGALAQIIANDQPVNAYYLKRFNGFTQAGQQIISDNPEFAGDPNPHYLLGVSTTFQHRKFTFTVNGSGAFDYLIYNNTHNTVANTSNLQKGQNIDASAMSSPESISTGVVASSRYLESGSYFKLRNATLTFALGDVSVAKNVNLYVSGTNLFVLTKFTGFDPEVNIDKSSNNYPSRNMEYIPYPTPRVISFGFNLGL